MCNLPALFSVSTLCCRQTLGFEIRYRTSGDEVQNFGIKSSDAFKDPCYGFRFSYVPLTNGMKIYCCWPSLLNLPSSALQEKDKPSVIQTYIPELWTSAKISTDSVLVAVSLTQSKVNWEHRSSRRIASTRLTCGDVWERLFWLMVDMGGASPLWVVGK